MIIRYTLVFVVIGIAAFGAWRLSLTVSPAASIEVPTTAVKRGDVTFTITAKGELQGGNTQMLQVPMTGGQPISITFLRASGELVQKDDDVVRFDTTEQEFKQREAEADVAEAEQHIEQATAEAEAKEEEMRFQLIKAKADLKIAQVEMRRNELVAAIVARQNELALAAAVEKLDKIEKDMENSRDTARSGIAIHQAARGKAKVKEETARRNIAAMTIKAKAPGYVAIQQNDEGNLRWGMYLPPYQVGDIARPGKAVAQIPDLSSWEATARIGELDRGHIAEGQSAVVSVVAIPGAKLPGKIKSIGGTTGPPWDRHFSCRIAIENTIPELRPGMSVRITVTTGSLKNALSIPAQAMFESGGRKFVYARKDNAFSPVDVSLVRRSESDVVVTGLKEGQEIAMANPDQAQKKQAASGALQSLPRK
jgi:HlyD family secretion protein